MQHASSLARGNYYGEPWYVEPRKESRCRRDAVEGLLVTGWRSVPEIAGLLDITPQLARYWVREVARVRLVFCHKRGRLHDRSWARTYRIYREATAVKAVAWRA